MSNKNLDLRTITTLEELEAVDWSKYMTRSSWEMDERYKFEDRLVPNVGDEEGTVRVPDLDRICDLAEGSKRFRLTWSSLTGHLAITFRNKRYMKQIRDKLFEEQAS